MHLGNVESSPLIDSHFNNDKQWDIITLSQPIFKPYIKADVQNPMHMLLYYMIYLHSM